VSGWLASAIFFNGSILRRKGIGWLSGVLDSVGWDLHKLIEMNPICFLFCDEIF
jgi:hypothetical protein